MTLFILLAGGFVALSLVRLDAAFGEI